MKNLKFGVLAFAVLGLVTMLLMMDFKIIDALKADAGNTIIVLVGFLAPLVVAIMGITKPPFQMWQGGVALGGFALVAIKFKIWVFIKLIADVPMSMKLFMVSIIGGIIVSAIALAKPEDKA